jgi:hypothetical protein
MNTRYEMATKKHGKKRSSGKGSGGVPTPDRPQKSDLPMCLRGETWPGQKTGQAGHSYKHK